MALTSHVAEPAFVARRQHEWTELERLLGAIERRGIRHAAASEITRFSELYRDLCGDLALADAAQYSAPLAEYLHALTARAHGIFYGSEPRARRYDEPASTLYDVVTSFARATRRRWRAVTISASLFFVPMLIGLVATLLDPTFAHRVVPEAELRMLTEAYLRGFEEGRGAGGDVMMAGFYIYNNVGIALRCFATGVFLGLGSAIYLVQNGLSIGATVGYVASHGAAKNIVSFMVGHGSLELGAIVIAGAAGLSMGWSIVSPGALTRLESLRRAARDVWTLVAGASLMLFSAAMIEAFWSASALPNVVKWCVGGLMFVSVMAYLVFAGRGQARRAE